MVALGLLRADLREGADSNGPQWQEANRPHPHATTFYMSLTLTGHLVMSSGQMWAPLEAGSSHVLEAMVRLGRMQSWDTQTATPTHQHPRMQRQSWAPLLAPRWLSAVPGVLVAHNCRWLLLAQVRLIGEPSIILPLHESGQRLLEGGEEVRPCQGNIVQMMWVGNSP